MNTRTTEEVNRIRASCDAYLSRHQRRTTKQWLSELSESPYARWELDQYGQGRLANELEERVRTILGKEAAVFMPKGTIAQQIALKVWAAEQNCTHVAIHPQSHMALDECDALSELSGLKPVQTGNLNQVMTLDDLEHAQPLPGVISLELPLRRAGFLLPTWGQLKRIFDWADANEIRLHLDGARIWESSDFYAANYAEIAARFDSVYVSLYKGLGAMGGCVLAGPKRFIEATLPWQSRFGGLLYTASPYLIGGLEGLDRHLPRMSEYVQTARAIARVVDEDNSLIVRPNPPQCNSFQVVFSQSANQIWDRCLEMAENSGIWLFDFIQPIGDSACMGEIQVGEATLTRNAEAWSGEILSLVSE